MRYNGERGNEGQEGAAVAVKIFEVWHEVDEFLTSTPTPKQIVAFHPSAEAQERLRRLLNANGNRTLTAEEEAELNETLAVEQFVRRLEVRALANRGSRLDPRVL